MGTPTACFCMQVSIFYAWWVILALKGRNENLWVGEKEASHFVIYLVMAVLTDFLAMFIIVIHSPCFCWLLNNFTTNSPMPLTIFSYWVLPTFQVSCPLLDCSLSVRFKCPLSCSDMWYTHSPNLKMLTSSLTYLLVGQFWDPARDWPILMPVTRSVPHTTRSKSDPATFQLG